MPLLKTKGIPALDLPNCEGWVNADIDITEGQGVVIGKSNPDGLLVATAKVAE